MRKPARPRSRFALLLVLALAILAGSLACQPAAPRPSRVVLVSIDTLRADRVGAYGASYGATPQIDALAAEGVVFETALAPTPITLPSHATLLTGLDPPAHGVHHNGVFELDAGIPTLAEALQAEGFATGAFVGAVVLDRQYGLARGFDHYDGRMALRQSSAGGYAERRAEDVVDAALAWAGETDGRFFLWIHFYDPHVTYDPPEPWRERFEDPYLGEIAYADSQLGRLKDGLAERFPDGQELWVVTSDHGEGLGQHGEATHGYTVFEATQRVPLVLAGPGLPSGARSAAPARLADVAPTVRALLGLSAAELSDGTDLRALLAPDAAQRSTYAETLAPSLDHGWSPLFSVREARFKYVRGPRPRLYDLHADPGEQENLASARPEEVARLDAALETHLAGARPLRPRGALDPERRAQLAALGYLPAEGTDSAPTAPLGQVGGLDPAEGMLRMTDWMRGRTLLGRGRARRALEVLLETRIDATAIHLDRAMAAVRAGDPALAERYARLGGHAGAPAPYPMGEARLVEGRLDDAERWFRRTLELEPSNGNALAGLGMVEEARGRREAAAELYRRAFEESRATSLQAPWRLAALRIEAGREAEGLALLQRLPAGERGRPLAAARIADAYLGVGDTAAAAQVLGEALVSYPDAEPLLGRLDPAQKQAAAELDRLRGRTLVARGRMRRGYEVLAATASDDPLIELERSWAAARSGQGELAERHARAAGEHPLQAYGLAEALLVQGRFDEAEAGFRLATTRQPGQGDVVAAIGRVKEARGEREAAARFYREGMESPAPSIEAVWRLAALSLEEGRPEEARRLLALIPRREARTPDAAARLARAEIHAGQPRAAARRVSLAFGSYPDADALLSLRTELVEAGHW